MKTVVSLAFLLSILLFVTGSAFAKSCETDLCYQVDLTCDNGFSDNEYWEACLNGSYGDLFASGVCFGDLPLTAFGSEGRHYSLEQENVFLGGSEFGSDSCLGEWYFQFSGHDMRRLDGIALWYDSSYFRCTAQGKQTPFDNCALPSDVTWKKNIEPLSSSLEKVMLVQGVSYDWKVDEYPGMGFTNDRQIGFIAQNVEKVFPELVQTDKNGYKGVYYVKMVPVLLEAIKEQQKEISELKKQQAQIDALTEKIAQLEKALKLKENNVAGE